MRGVFAGCQAMRLMKTGVAAARGTVRRESGAVILFLNGAFGIGKTTVARLVVRRVPRALLFDPEPIGIALQRAARLVGRDVADFQHLRLWRRLTIAGLRLVRLVRPTIVVPMAFSELRYLDEIRSAARTFDANVAHLCLIAPVETVYDRLRRRGDDPVRSPWEFRRAAECCAAHPRPEFATHLDALKTPEELADQIARMM
jgi:hypothetical protein